MGNILPFDQTVDIGMTIEKCIDHCNSFNNAYSGVYGGIYCCKSLHCLYKIFYIYVL